MDWSRRSPTSNPCSRSPVPKKSGDSCVCACMGNAFDAFLRRLKGRLRGCEEGSPGDLAPEEIGSMVVEVGGFVKELGLLVGQRKGRRRTVSGRAEAELLRSGLLERTLQRTRPAAAVSGNIKVPLGGPVR